MIVGLTIFAIICCLAAAVAMGLEYWPVSVVMGCVIGVLIAGLFTHPHRSAPHGSCAYGHDGGNGKISYFVCDSYYPPPVTR